MLRICTVDGQGFAKKICICKSPPEELCESCIPKHISKEGVHSIMSIEALPYCHIPGYPEQLTKRNKIKEQVISQLRENISLVKACQDQLIAQISQIMMKLSAFSKQKYTELETLKKSLENENEKAVKEYLATFYDPYPQLELPLAVMLRNSEDGCPLPPLFSFSSNILGLDAHLTDLFTYKQVNITNTVVATVVKPDGVFEYLFSRRTWVGPTPFQGNIDVSEYSASVKMEKGVFVCGGFQDRGNG